MCLSRTRQLVWNVVCVMSKNKSTKKACASLFMSCCNELMWCWPMHKWGLVGQGTCAH
jgi:hypothetical protein